MSTARLAQIPPPEDSRDLLERPADALAGMGPFILGGGDLDLLCPKCDSMLADGIDGLKAVEQVVFRCQGCGTLQRNAGLNPNLA